MPTANWGWMILAFPLWGTIVIGLGWQRWRGRAAGWLGTFAIAGSFVGSIGALVSLLSKNPDQRSVVANAFDYINVAGVHVKLGILIDPLSVFMCLVVSGVSMLIHLYSVAYMDSDRGYTRFFAYLNYFVFSMLLLVLASNFVLLIVGWAFVGAASYLLISFWYRRESAVAAGIKAFVMNVIGYMVLGVSSFGYAAGLFHLMTHAFFKALLFMGAGSVISAMGGVQNLDRMGGFRRAMPFTFVTFTTGALALAGFPLMSGWFSKDSIIGYTFHRGGTLYTTLGVIALVTAFMTAFYA